MMCMMIFVCRYKTNCERKEGIPELAVPLRKREKYKECCGKKEEGYLE